MRDEIACISGVKEGVGTVVGMVQMSETLFSGDGRGAARLHAGALQADCGPAARWWL
jgi:hypothetical protein